MASVMSGDHGGDKEGRRKGTETDWKLTASKDGNKERARQGREKETLIFIVFSKCFQPK